MELRSWCPAGPMPSLSSRSAEKRSLLKRSSLAPGFFGRSRSTRNWARVSSRRSASSRWLGAAHRGRRFSRQRRLETHIGTMHLSPPVRLYPPAWRRSSRWCASLAAGLGPLREDVAFLAAPSSEPFKEDGTTFAGAGSEPITEDSASFAGGASLAPGLEPLFGAAFLTAAAVLTRSPFPSFIS